jgi:hypothetical protein
MDSQIFTESVSRIGYDFSLNYSLEDQSWAFWIK